MTIPNETPAEPIAAEADRLLAEATLPEKVAMMSGRGFFRAFKADGRRWGARPYRAGSGIDRLGVDPLYFTDGPRGVARGHSTCFPCTMARGASFDADLETRIGEAMGIEARAQGCTLSGAVCINLLRHPAWGRAQETYGEDPHHLGRMGAALGLGIQAHGVIATVKHFALNSMENARFTVDVRIDERSLHELYLPHFKHCLDAGVASVMSAYNQVNGEYCGQHRGLLTDILRGEWGFTGFVHSDWVKGVYQTYGAAAGLDIENPEPLVWGDKLLAAVEAGQIEPMVIDQACHRILTTQLRFARAETPLEAYPQALVASAAHVALAQEAAEKSAVLLENDGVLPLAADRIGRLAVLGRLARLPNTGDNGSSRVQPPFVITALDGLTEWLGAERIVTAEEDDLAAVTAAAAGADAVVAVVGLTAREEGEFVPGDIALGQDGGGGGAIGGDRLDLSLPADQVAMLRAAAATGTPLVVVIVAGSAILVEDWRDQAGAILQTFYAGMAGGRALARLLSGAVSPSGRLPFTVARDPVDYPHFDRDAAAITYDYWHGYGRFEAQGRTPRYAFGHGLSYARFAYRGLTAQQQGDRIAVQVAVRNHGDMAAEEVVLAFIGFPGGIQPRWPRRLAAFTRVALAPGETRIVRLVIAIDDLRWRDPATHQWRLEPGRYRIMVGDREAALDL